MAIATVPHAQNGVLVKRMVCVSVGQTSIWISVLPFTAQLSWKDNFTTIILFPHLYLREYLAHSVNFVVMIMKIMIM